MTADTTASGYSRPSVLAGWVLAIIYAVHSAITVLMPRSDKFSPLRESLRSWHYLFGLILFALLLWRLWLWYRESAPPPPRGLKPAGHVWARQLAITTYVVLAIMPLLGIAAAWTDGLVVRLGPLFSLPALLGESRPAWMFSGYFHSALSFAVLLLNVVTAATAVWFALRRGVGMVRALPPGFGLQVWAGLGITVYAFSTFKPDGPGVLAVSVYCGLSAAVWLLSRYLHRNSSRVTAAASAGMGARVASVAATLLVVAVAAPAPNAMFGVTPWPMGEVVAAPEGVTSHAGPVMTVTVTPPSPQEAEVNGEIFKWCSFCHTFQQGGKHLVGPNLYAIFGQKAGTVPNFHYTPAMAEAGRKGLVWTDDTLDQFLAGPGAFVPGTSMVMSIGPVKTPEERAAVINLLKKATMPGAR
jgi:cytochrome c2/cytochrome b561